MKHVVRGTVVSIAASGALFAAAYKLPEQSVDSMGLAAAYVAHTTGADSAYFNPANMAFLPDRAMSEAGATLVHLPANDYTLVAPYSASSEEENIVVPFAHYVAPASGNLRWGVSLTVPGGLTKRWHTPFQKLYAEEFTLKIIELNPSFSYKISDNFAIGGGIRFIYSEGVVKSNGADAAALSGNARLAIARDMEGDTWEVGYNIALSYKPLPDMTLALTYRSNVDLDEEGDATLSAGPLRLTRSAFVSVPLPATLSIAAAKTWNDTFTLELVYERTYWSEYKALDFNYGSAIPEALVPAFDAPIQKAWRDTDTFRLGMTWQADERWTLMAGIGIDETPVPDRTIGFELPDSDATLYAFGVRYRYDEHLSIGFSMLYDDKEERTLRPGVADNAVLVNGGVFDGGGALLTTLGVRYEY